MIFNIEFWNLQKYLPTKRHKRLKERYEKSSVDVEIKEVTEQEFPIAFIVHNYKPVYENAKTYEDFTNDSKYKMFSEEIRTYNSKLYMPVRISQGAAISLCFESFDYIKKRLTPSFPYRYREANDFTENSIVKEDDIEACKKSILVNAENFLIYDGKVWKTCGEPIYRITTFGCGNNHGGTGFFIEYVYDSNDDIGYKNFFNALQREQAIAYGKKVAFERGDTNYIDNIGNHDIIEVLMPEMVKKNPQKEYEEKNVDRTKKEILKGLKELQNACSRIAPEFCHSKCPYQDICLNLQEMKVGYVGHRPCDWNFENLGIHI